MLAWFHENNTTIYLLLGVALVILAALWYRTQDRRFLRAIVAVAALLVALGLLDRFGPESPGREMTRKLKEMAAAVKAKNMDRLFQHVADSFAYGSLDKAAIRAIAQRVIVDRGEVSELEVWNFERPLSVPGKPGEPPIQAIQFFVKVRGPEIPQEPFLKCITRFVQDPDGQWRVQSFELYLMPGGTRYHPSVFPL